MAGLLVNCRNCGYENREGVRFCEGCGSSLGPSCPSCGAELPEGVRFCGQCGAPVEADPVWAADGALKVVSVVFADLVGSTALQEALDTESTRRVMTRFYERMRAVVERHDGELEKFIGDAVVVVFGAPILREDDALRAVRCGLAMTAELEELNDELEPAFGVRLQLRIGINTGELVVNDEGILVGDTMNTTARLEQAAGAGEVLIGEATRRLVRREAELEEIEPLSLKGKATPVRAWRVLAVASGPAARLDAPLVGRDRELDRLRAVLDEAIASRSCRLVSVIGSPGLGKSRLAQEFAAAVSADVSVLSGHCEPSGEGITFLPVADVLRDAAGIAEGDPPETVVQKLSALLPEDADHERIVARAAALLGAGESASPEETFWSVRRLLEALATRRPVVVVLDDVHWGQPLFLDLIEHLIEWVRDAPLLLVALARPELREEREALATGRRATDVIEIEPLDPSESRALVDGLLGSVDLPAPLLERIFETTDGNPLFLGELLRMLVDEGALVQTADAWVAAGGAEAVQVPPTIQALLTARIERLRPHERTVVERASVIGKQFYRGAVAELVAPPVRSGIDGHLETLRRKDMIEPEGTYWIDEPVYRFHHVLIRDAAYHLLLKEARAELHEKFADWLAAKAGELVGEHEEVIAYHLEQAFEYRGQLGPLDDRGRAIGARAAELFWSAGKRALEREDLAAAANLLARAHECGADDAVLWDLGEALLSAGDTAGAAAVVDRVPGARGVVLETQLAVLTGTGAEVSRIIAATAELAAADDGIGTAKGYHVTAQVQAQLGQVADVEASLDHALLAARKAGDRRRITAVLAAAPRAALWGPSPVVRASGRCLDVVRILRMTPGNRHVEAVALRCQAVLEAMRGRADAARDILAAGRTTLEELGLTLELQELSVHAGIVELLAGRPDAAEALLRPARDGFATLGVSVSAAQAAALLARALVDQGRDEEAIAETEFAEQRAGGDLKTTITWCGVRAEALARRGAIAEAVALARRAVALAGPTDALADKADANVALARVLGVAGLREEARAAAESARVLYAAKDHAVGVERAGAPIAAPVAPDAESAPAETRQIDDPELARFFSRYADLWRERDTAGLVALHDDDYVMRDHRKLGWGERRGLTALEDQLSTAMGVSTDLRFCIDRVFACKPGLIAMQIAMRGHSVETGGEVVLPLGFVVAFRNGKITRQELFEPDAEISIRACFDEYRGLTLLGNRPVERWWAQFVRQFAQRDRGALTDLYAEDFLLVDHRAVGLEEVNGREMMLDLAASAWQMAPDIRAVINEVIACDDRVSIVLLTFVGSGADGGGAIEIPVGYVSVFADGRGIRGEQFDPSQRVAMIARYAELGGTGAVATVRAREIADPEIATFYARFAELWQARDADGLLACRDPEYELIDHRQLGWSGLPDLEALEDTVHAALAMSDDLSFAVDEVLECDRGVIAMKIAFRGHSSETGGELEIPMGCVVVFRGGRIRREELFEPDAEPTMRACFAEKVGLTRLGELPSARWWAWFVRLFGQHDREALREAWSEDFVLVDHRSMAWEETHGLEEMLDLVESAWQMAPDIRASIDEVIAADERMIAGVIRYVGSGADGGGALEIAIGYVTVVADGRGIRAEQFDPHDEKGILARYRELGGTGAAEPSTADAIAALIPDPEIAGVYTRVAAAFAARDPDAIAANYADDYVRIDHRAVGWAELNGPDEFADSARATMAVSPDVSYLPEKVLAYAPGLIAVVLAGRGHFSEGDGEFELMMGRVARIVDGQLAYEELFEPDAESSMLACFADLKGRMLLGDRRSERIQLRWLDCFARHDEQGLRELIGDDYRLFEHRHVGWENHKGQADHLAVSRSAWETWPDIRQSVDEVLACDENTIAYRCTYHGTNVDGGGSMELPVGYVCSYGETGHRDVHQFDYDDTEGMLACYRELGGVVESAATRPPERWLLEFQRRWNGGDQDRAIELFDENFTLTDRRRIALWGEVRGRDAQAAIHASSRARFEVDEVIAADEHVIASRIAWRGEHRGGEHSTEVGAVSVIRNGLHISMDVYDPDDRQTMLARYRELGGVRRAELERLPERSFAEHVARFNRHDVDADLELIADDFEYVDRRAISLGSTRGRDAHRETLLSIFEVAPDARTEVQEVIACDDRVIAVGVRYHGHSVDGTGEFELLTAYVVLVENGLWQSVDQYEPDDRETMLARFAELSDVSVSEPQPLKPWERFDLLYNARRFEELEALYTEDYKMIDRRAMAWEEIEGGAALVATCRSFIEMAPDLVSHCGVLAEASGFCLLRNTFAGHGFATGASEAGPIELVFDEVGIIRNDQFAYTELFDPADETFARARYEELVAGGSAELPADRSELSIASDPQRMSDRVWTRYLNAYNDHEVETAASCLGDDWTVADHRGTGMWDEVQGRDAWAQQLQTVWNSRDGDDIRLELVDTLAQDDRVGAWVVKFSGSDSRDGPYEVVMGWVMTFADEQISSLDMYESEERAAMLVRFAELGGGQALLGDSPPERWWSEALVAYARGDLDALVALYSEDWTYVEHRQLGWEEMTGHVDLREFWRSAIEVSSARYGEIEEVTAADHRVVVVRVTWHGFEAEHGGEFALPVGNISVIEAGRNAYQEQYDPDDRERMLARYVELGGSR